MAPANQTAQPPLSSIDWNAVARTMVESPFWAGLLGGALHVVAKLIEEEQQGETTTPDDDAPEDDSDDDGDEEASDAATLLGVSLDATESQIRAALRARFATSRLHPDHGGDGDEAKRLIAAKNLLVERARAVR
jgi:hypothetical protein